MLLLNDAVSTSDYSLPCDRMSGKYWSAKKRSRCNRGPQSLIRNSRGQMCFRIQNFSDFRKAIR